MNDSSKAVRWYRRWSWKKLIVRGALLFGCVLAMAAGFVYWKLQSSLPILNGELEVASLTAAVKVERDSAGVPTITSENRCDTAFALGFLHAQERFFQMDILRRVSSGRLSELLGTALIKTDQKYRKHRFQKSASYAVEQMPADHRIMFRAYCDGVNRGLQELGSTPFEYFLLRTNPAPWTEQDCFHVMQTMLADLQQIDGEQELAIGRFHESVPPEVFDFLVRKGSSWDAAIDATTIDSPPIPPEEIWSLRDSGPVEKSEIANDAPVSKATELSSLFSDHDPRFRPGSNNWAISAALGKDDRAILASDMHLGLRVPAIWYRAVMHTPCLDGKKRRLVGVTLPGVPGLVEGSNGEVAWGMTNSYGDFGDIIELSNNSDESNSPETYMTPVGPKKIERVTEELNVGGSMETIEYETTVWGPVVANIDGRRFVHHWIGDDPDALDTKFFEMESAESTDQALDICNGAGILQLNIVVADRQGSVGWTLSGRLAKRELDPSRTIQDWSRKVGWNGYLSPKDYPRIENPPEGRLWTANNRVVGGAMMKLVGDSGMDNGGRAHQIRKRLFERDAFSENDLLDIQLDDEALFLSRWQEMLLKTIRENPDLVSGEFQTEIEKWGGRASVDSVGYRIVRSFRANVFQYFFGLDKPGVDIVHRQGAIVTKANLEQYLSLSYEAAIWDLLTKRPRHWLPAEFESWDELLVDAAKNTQFAIERIGPINEATWGARNLTKIRHPLSASIPLLSSWLDMPVVPLPGDRDMPRVQGQAFGASQRMVVSPGFEEKGFYHQPGGQSGHPSSPYYRAGYNDWCEGKPSPLLPGPTKYSLKLVPK